MTNGAAPGPRRRPDFDEPEEPSEVEVPDEEPTDDAEDSLPVDVDPEKPPAVGDISPTADWPIKW